MSSDAEVLERFHRALIEEIQTQRPEYLTGPFTVAEIYQNLVPYGSHRDRIGVDMNADYEDALLRLLAGEGGFLVLESEPALRDIQSELKQSNPNTGLYREFAAVDVRLNQSRLDLSAAAVDELTDLADELEAEVPVPMQELAPAESSQTALGIVPPGVDIFAGRNGPQVPASVGPADPSGLQDLDLVPDGRGPETTQDDDPEIEPEIEAAHDDVDDEPASPAVKPGGLQPEFVEPERPTGRAAGGQPCQWCRATLPEREKLNFCPYCGTDLALVPCPSCGDEVEPEWRFCASCGTEVTT